jgi:hypothetical protein
MDLAACRYIVIEGPIGAGKTSHARELAQRLHAEELLEQPDDNPFLARFYDDVARFAPKAAKRRARSSTGGRASRTRRTRSARRCSSPTRRRRSAAGREAAAASAARKPTATHRRAASPAAASSAGRVRIG